MADDYNDYFSTFKIGSLGKGLEGNLQEYTKEEYLQMSDKDKGSYHFTMSARSRRDGNMDLSRWYDRMGYRIRRGSKLPTYYSPEHEAEESS